LSWRWTFQAAIQVGVANRTPVVPAIFGRVDARAAAESISRRVNQVLAPTTLV
jgi:hypothetical protein